LLPIFVGGPEAAAIALALSGEFPPRPSTHDVMAALVESLDAQIERVEVTEVREGAFLAELTVSGPSGGHRLDTRPSDAIVLAVRLHAPLFVSDAVLDEAGTTLQEAADEDTIDDEVSEFRSFLDEIDPADFGTGTVRLSSSRHPATRRTNPAAETPNSAGRPPSRTVGYRFSNRPVFSLKTIR
jgi:hypothetical protein